MTLLPEMAELLARGEVDCVAARRTTRDGETDYRMVTRQVRDAVLTLPEVNRFTKGIYAWVGFRTRWLEFENVDHAVGESKWSFWGLVRYSIQGLSAFSADSLQLASVLGVVCCLAALAYLFYILGKTLLVGEAVGGWPTLACLILFLGGLQLFVIGILGTSLAKHFRRRFYGE